MRDAARAPASLINNIYWWSGVTRKCTFRPRRPSKYAGSGAGSAGFRASLNHWKHQFRPRGVPKSDRAPSGFRRVPNSLHQRRCDFRPRGVPKSGRVPSGFQRVPAAIEDLLLHLVSQSAQGVLQSTRVPYGFRRVPASRFRCGSHWVPNFTVPAPTRLAPRRCTKIQLGPERVPADPRSY